MNRTKGSKEKLAADIIEKMKALLAAGYAKNSIAEKLNVSWSTVDRYSQDFDGKEMESLREQKKREFIADAWQDIKAAMYLGRQKIKLATVTIEQFQPTIDRLVQLLEQNDDTNGRDIVELIKALSSVTNIPLAHISTYFGTLYDKQALANGEATSRSEATVDNRHSLDLSALSDEELNFLEKILGGKQE